MRTSDSLGLLALGVTMGAKLWSWGETRGPLADGGGERISVYCVPITVLTMCWEQC